MLSGHIPRRSRNSPLKSPGQLPGVEDSKINAWAETESDVLAQTIFKIFARDDLENIDFKLNEKDGRHGLLREPINVVFFQ
jgi:hypothetical protein